MPVHCPSPVLVLIDRLHEAGHEAYVVGGSLRDSLLGRPPHDWDVATSALPAETQAAMAGYRTIETGLQHGTLTVLAPVEGGEPMPVEITTYRIDGDYLDARHPASVAFTRSLADDLARRDFTVCAMAWSPYDMRAEGGIVDLFDGRGDLARRLIRCVGDPETRFREDALRILRAYRFAAELDFAIDDATRAGARATAHLLARISAERIASELRRTLLGIAADRALAMMAADGILAEICPDADGEAAAILAALPPDFATRLSALFWRAPTERATAAVAALRYPNATIRAVTATLSLRDHPLAGEPGRIARQLRRAGGDDAAAALLALRAAFGEDVAGLREALAASMARGECVDIAHLAVGGADLAAIGIPRGPAIGRTLAALLDAVVDDPANNQRDILLGLAAQGKGGTP